MGVSKLIFNNETLIDLTDVSVSSSNLHISESAHGADGSSVIGAAASSFPVENALVDGSFSGTYTNNRIKTLGYTSSLRALKNITSVNLPNVTTFHGYDFDGDTSLVSVNAPLVTSFGDGYNFRNCTNLTSVSFPSLTRLPPSAFQNCSALSIIDAACVTQLAGGPLQGCTALTSITLSNVTDVGGYSFNNCNNLTVLVLPKWTYASGEICKMQYMSSLHTVDLKIQRLQGGDLSNNPSLNKIILRRTASICVLNSMCLGSTCFASGNSGGEIYVPKDLIDTYKTATNWITYDGYGTITWKAIEDSIYKDYYADGTPITS